jgi:hypothetical protein
MISFTYVPNFLKLLFQIQLHHLKIIAFTYVPIFFKSLFQIQLHHLEMIVFHTVPIFLKSLFQIQLHHLGIIAFHAQSFFDLRRILWDTHWACLTKWFFFICVNRRKPFACSFFMSFEQIFCFDRYFFAWFLKDFFNCFMNYFLALFVC